MAAQVEYSVKGFFKLDRSRRQPFLAPIGASARFPRLPREALERLPASAAPIAVTLLGGVALVVALAALPGPEAEDAPPPQQAPLASGEHAPPAQEETRLPDPEPQPAAVAAETAADLPASEPEPDPARTASILPALPSLPGSAAFVPSVPVAETDEEIAALEEIQRREVEEDVGPPSVEATASIDPDAGRVMRAAVATSYVNMRAGPDDDAEVLTVVPALAEIEAEEDCNWCAVVYDGREGFVYRSFIRYAD